MFLHLDLAPTIMTMGIGQVDLATVCETNYNSGVVPSRPCPLMYMRAKILFQLSDLLVNDSPVTVGEPWLSPLGRLADLLLQETIVMPTQLLP